VIVLDGIGLAICLWVFVHSLQREADQLEEWRRETEGVGKYHTRHRGIN